MPSAYLGRDSRIIDILSAAYCTSYLVRIIDILSAAYCTSFFCCSKPCLSGYWGSAGQSSPTCSGLCSAVRESRSPAYDFKLVCYSLFAVHCAGLLLSLWIDNTNGERGAWLTIVVASEHCARSSLRFSGVYYVYVGACSAVALRCIARRGLQHLSLSPTEPMYTRHREVALVQLRKRVLSPALSSLVVSLAR
jgi:hypothetical protein